LKLIDALREAEHQLRISRTDTPLLESEVLIRHILKISRAMLYMSLQDPLPDQEWMRIQKLINRRLQGEPVAYITSTKEFYNLQLHVDSRVLIPRPETEILVDEALSIAAGIENPVICDVGTGSGAIAAAIAYNNPSAEIFAIDSSLECLEVARDNIRALGAGDRVVLLHGNLLEPFEKTADVICANLPYVKHSQIEDNMYEPVSSLDGGENGLKVIEQLVQQYFRYLNPGGKLLIEIGDGQEPAVKTLLNQYTPAAAISTRTDLAGIVRVVTAGRV